MRSVAAFCERSRVILFVGLAILIFAGAGFIRLRLPDTVIFNPDSWGYIGPSMLHGESGVFAQTHGRAFFYPALLHCFSSASSDLDRIAAWQHLLGLGAGALWLLIWMLWAGGLPSGWLRRWAAPLIGLAGLAVFLFNGMGLIFEMHIRPEGVFPFFALLQLLFLGAALRLGVRAGSSWMIVLLCALGCVAALASAALKPSWTMTLATLPLLAGLIFLGSRRGLPGASALFGMLLGAALWLAGTGMVKNHLGWQADAASKLFLPQSLVSVHADLVLRSTPVESAFPGFRSELADAFARSEANVKPYERLGFNPDVIFYETLVFRNLEGTDEEKRRFLMGLYFQALREHPLPMMRKWCLQFASALYPERNWIYRRDYQLGRDYERAAADLRMRGQWEGKSVRERLEALALAAEETGSEIQKTTRLTWEINRSLVDVLRLLVPLGLVCSLVAGLVFVFKAHSPWRFCALESFFWGATFLSAIATVAIVHSFDIDRYAEILNFLNLLLGGVGAVTAVGILGAIATRFLPPGWRRFFRPSGESPGS